MTDTGLLKALSQCKNKTILVLGDIMLDEYHWCQVKRISPEAPVPVCKVEKTTLVPGGAGNVAYNIQALNSTPILAGVIGSDSSGEKLMSLLSQSNLLTDVIIQDRHKPTILKSRIVAHQQQVVRVDREDITPIPIRVRNQLFQKIKEIITTLDAIIISDYLKGTLPDRFIQRIIQLAAQHKKRIIIDPKGDHYGKYKGATVLTPNFKEFEIVVGKKVATEEDIHAEGKKLVKRLSLDYLLITRSEKGMTLICKNGTKCDISTKAKDVYDITGAGDTVISMLAIALSAGCNMETATTLANYAAGLVVGKIGTATTTLNEIQTTIKA